jgi:long-chain acyl-CoA synthetase
MTTLIDLLERSAAVHGDSTALTIRAGLREDAWSYRRLAAAADALAAHLTEDVGLEPGARVVVWGPNSPQLVAALFGMLRARLVVVPLDPYATTGLLERVVERTGAELLLSGHGALPGMATLDLATLPFDSQRRCTSSHPRPEDVAEIVFTSGTTGRPKGVVLTHANVIANVGSARAALQPTRDYRLLSVLPLSHMFEQTAGLFLPLSVGASVHYATSRQAPVILKTLRRHRVTAMAVVPQMLELLLARIEQEVARRGSLDRWRAAHRLAPLLPTAARRALFRSVHRELGGRLELVVSGGAELDPEVAAAWERLGVTVLEGYGATECAPSIASNTRAARRAGSVGCPVPGVDVRIGEQGEILVRGANVSPGYWRDEEATRSAFADDGWYRTGDLGALDRDGFLYLHGRLKDLIVLPSGLNVFPEDVERELLREDAVADCAVIGVQDEERRLRVHAVVVPAQPGAEAQRRVADAVRAANARLAPHQRISSFTLWEHGDLPCTSLLKVKRHEVAATLAGRPPAEPSPERPAPAVDRHDRLLRLLGDLAPPGTPIRPESDLALDLVLDSLARVELAVRLEGELGLSVEDGDLASALTVGELVRLVDAGELVSQPIAFPWWALRAPARAARTALQALVLLPVHALVCSPFRVQGLEHVVGIESPVLLVANHSSHLDTPSILRALPRRLRARVAVAAAADYFFRTRPLAVAMPLLLNAFPFSREGAVRSSLEHCGDLADRGWSVLVYPEGTRSPTGRLQPFRTGTGLLATELGALVVPIGVDGCHALLPKGRRRPRRGPVTVRFGPAFRPRPGETHPAAAAELADAVSRLLPAETTATDTARASS